MAVIKMKPTSPGMRGMVRISRDHLHKGEPYAPLLEPQFQKSGRTAGESLRRAAAERAGC